MVTDAAEDVRRYVVATNTYLQNALSVLQRKEPGKAGELLWGAMAQAMQAVAASRGIRIANHRSMRHFANTLAKELSDRSLALAFQSAERLHSNFHEVELEVQDVEVALEPIRESVRKLLDLIPPEILAAPDTTQTS